MTLATLKGMNFNFGDVAHAFKLKAADAVMSGMQKVTEKASGATATVGSFAGTVSGAVAPQPAEAKKSTQPASKTEEPDMAAGLADPLLWWGALTKQFGDIANTAMKEAAKQTAIDVTQGVATDMAGAVGKAMTSAKAASKKPAKKVAAKKRAR